MLKKQLWVAIFFFFCLLSGCINEKTEEYEGGDISVGDKLPTFAVTLSDGTTVNDGVLSGRISLIILFSVDCGDCQKQLPVIEKVWQRYQDDEEVLLFGISRAEGAAKVGKYWSDEKLTLPYSAQDDRYLYSLFAKSVVPRIYISDSDGIVRFTFSDKPLATEAQLVEAIEGLKK